MTATTSISIRGPTAMNTPLTYWITFTVGDTLRGRTTDRRDGAAKPPVKRCQPERVHVGPITGMRIDLHNLYVRTPDGGELILAQHTTAGGPGADCGAVWVL